jgi:glycosyltransferase involved in cell wall biosynthesis
MSYEQASGPEARVQPTQPVPRVSVIIIFLNPGRYLAEAIESVLSQSWSDWELVLVDDGSSDVSTEVAKHWVERLPGKVRYLEHPGHVNCGMSASRNLGLRQARGHYVAFLDADDVFLPERLAEHVAILEEWPNVAMVQSDHDYWYQWKDRRHRTHEATCRRPPLFLGDVIIRPPDGLLMLFGVPDAFTAICSITIRRSVALELGGFEQQFRGLYEDQVFLTKVYAHHAVYSRHAHLAKYRIHAGGALAAAVANIRGTRGVFFEATRRLREWQTEYVKDMLGREPLLEELFAAHLSRATERRSIRLQSLAALGRQVVHRLMRRFLPLPSYRRMLQRRQAWSARRAKLQHDRLCSRVAGRRLAVRSVEPYQVPERP